MDVRKVFELYRGSYLKGDSEIFAKNHWIYESKINQRKINRRN